MVGILMGALIIFSVCSLPLFIIMRVRLMRADSARDRLSWLHRGGSEVLNVYEVLYPGSHLPKICRAAFWTIVAAAALLLGAVLVTK
jgi:hypothetical protein